jgi:hypothetical protein
MAYNTTLSDESEKDTSDKGQKFMAFIASHEDSEGHQSYYSESSDNGEELKEAYKILYVKFLKLRKTHQQHILELNGLKTEKGTLPLKIQDVEEKLLETQLQLEKVIDEKITHMLSVQKFMTDKIGLRYVASTFDISSTSKTVFENPTFQEPPPTSVDKVKGIVGGEVVAAEEPSNKPPTKRSPPTCHHCGICSHIQPWCP